MNLDKLTMEIEKSYEDGTIFRTTLENGKIRYSILNIQYSFWNNTVEKCFNRCIASSVLSNFNRSHPVHARSLVHYHTTGNAPMISKYVKELMDNDVVKGALEKSLNEFLSLYINAESRDIIDNFINICMACIGVAPYVDWKQIDEDVITDDELHME